MTILPCVSQPARIIEAPDRIGGQTVTPRHMFTPEYSGAPSSGCSCLRTAECSPSQATATRLRRGGRGIPVAASANRTMAAESS